MSLAENLLNSLDGTSYQNAALSDQEEHIKVGQDRVITVPNALKNIAVKGDKDIETVTFDCVRYWDGHDLSTFAIYINYILPNGDEGTYIPESITRYEDVFSFDWEIGSEITYVPGKLTFWIVTKLTDDSGVLIKQWSSFQNSDCTIAQGGDKTYVPSQTDQDVISQAISILRASAERAEEQANIATEAAEKAASDATAAAEEEVTLLVGELGVVQETGISPTSVISQAGATRSFAHALNGKESGGAVLCEEVSPVLHPVVAGVRSRNLIPFPYAFGTSTTEAGVTFVANSDGSVTVNGTAGGNIVMHILDISALDGDYFISGCPAGGSENNYQIIVDENGIGVAQDYGSGAKFSASNGNTYSVIIYITKGTVVSNLVFKPMINKGTTAEPYTPYVADGTAVKVTSAGANLAQPNNDLQKRGCSVKVASDDKITLTATDGYDSTYARVARILLKANTEYTISIQDAKNVQNAFLWKANTTIGDVINSEITYTPSKDEYFDLAVYMPDHLPVGSVASFYLMVNEGSTAIPHERYNAGQTIDTAVGSTIDLPSIAPYMSVYTDTEGTAVDVTYVKDTNAVVQKLVNAIVALGGNV